MTSGEKALEVLESGAQFDAILMDYKMPQMNGLTCTKLICEMESQSGSGRRTPIIEVSAYSADECRKECLAAYMDDFIGKPFEIDAFRSMLLRSTYNPARPNLSLLAEDPK